jgi:hypothetical protein
VVDFREPKTNGDAREQKNQTAHDGQVKKGARKD